MNAEDLTLNIAINLDRLARFAMEGRSNRIELFLQDTQDYLNQLEETPKTKKFQRTFEKFKQVFNKLKNNSRYDQLWAENALTWANILTHRAKLA